MRPSRASRTTEDLLNGRAGFSDRATRRISGRWASTVVIRASFGCAPRPAKTVSSEDPVGPIRQIAKAWQARGCHEPSQTHGGIGSAEDLHSLDEVAIRKHPVNPGHQVTGIGSILARIEFGIRDVLELDPTPTAISLFEEADLAGAQWTFSIVEDSDLPLSFSPAHTPCPIRST